MSGFFPPLPNFDDRALWEDVPFRFCIKDRQGRFLYMNKACRADHGVSDHRGYLNTTDADYFDGAHVINARQVEEEILRTGEARMEYEEYETWKGGRKNWVSTTKFAIDSALGEKLLICFVRNVTRDKITFERYRTSVESSGLGLWYDSFDTLEVWYSPGWKKILGYEPEELPNTHEAWVERIHPDDKDAVLQACERHITRGFPYEAVYRLRHRNGRYRWIRARGQAQRDANGEVIAFAGAHEDTTDAKRIEDNAVRTLDALPGFVWIKDQDRRFVYVNQLMAVVLGRKPEDLVGLCDADLIDDEEQIQRFRADDQKVLLTGDRLHVGEECLSIAGKTYRLATVKTLLTARDGSPQILGVAMDISDLYETKARLAREEQRLQELIDQLPEGVFFKNRAGEFTRANKAFAQMLGHDSVDAIIGKTNAHFFEGGYVGAATAEDGRVFKGQTVRSRLRAGKTSEGRFFRVVTKAPVIDSLGQITELCGIVQDVTHLMSVQRELRDEKNLLRNILDILPVCVFLKDEDGKYLMCNRTFAERHGLTSPQSVRGLTDKDLSTPEMAARYREDDRQVLESEEPRLRYREEQIWKGETRVIETSKLPLRRRRLLGVYEDITASLAADRLAFQQEVAKSFGHCVKNWLTVLKDDLALLARRRPDVKKEPAYHRLEEVGFFLRETAYRAISLVKPALTGENTIFCIATELAKLTAILDDARIRLALPDHPVLCRGVVTDFRNALMDLLNNAIHFTPPASEGGSIHIVVTTDGEQSTIQFSNNGEPIPEELCRSGPTGVPKIFEWFTTASADRAGMGLPYAKWVFESMGGSIHLERSNQGAHFRVRLPLTEDSIQ